MESRRAKETMKLTEREWQGELLKDQNRVQEREKGLKEVQDAF